MQIEILTKIQILGPQNTNSLSSFSISVTVWENQVGLTPDAVQCMPWTPWEHQPQSGMSYSIYLLIM
jgi:hypothetical protein